MPIKLSKFLSTAIVFIVALVLLWMGILGAEKLARPQSMPAQLPVTLYLPDVNGEIDVDADPIIPEFINEPAYVYRDSRRSKGGVFVHEFNWSSEDGDVALFMTWSRRISRIELNGSPIALEPTDRKSSLLAGYVPVAYILDADLLVDGLNSINIKDKGISKKVLPAFGIVPVEEAFKAQFWGRFFNIDLVIASIGVMVFLIIFCGLVNWPKEERRAIRFLMLLLFCWCLRSLSSLGFTSDFFGPFRVLSAYWISYALIASFAVYVSVRAKLRPRITRFLFVIFGVCILSTALTLPFGNQRVFQVAFPIETWLILGLTAFIVVTLLKYSGRDKAFTSLEAVFLFIGVGSIAIDAIDDKFELWIGVIEWMPYVYYASPRYGLLIALGMCSAIAIQQTRARLLAVNMNHVLNERLSEKQVELEKSYQTKRASELKAAALAERERIMMDVHDGLGAQLMSLEALVHMENPPVSQIKKVVQGSIVEVRFIADALNNVGSDLQVTLSSLRYRLRPQFEKSEIDLNWNVSPVAASVQLDTDLSMHLSRIILEAMTNIVRHSGASEGSLTLGVESQSSSDFRELHLEISDNGCGLNGSQGGRGLSFMKTRARRMGADMQIRSDAHGVSIVLSLPLLSDGEAQVDCAERAAG